MKLQIKTISAPSATQLEELVNSKISLLIEQGNHIVKYDTLVYREKLIGQIQYIEAPKEPVEIHFTEDIESLPKLEG